MVGKTVHMVSFSVSKSYIHNLKYLSIMKAKESYFQNKSPKHLPYKSKERAS